MTDDKKEDRFTEELNRILSTQVSERIDSSMSAMLGRKIVNRALDEIEYRPMLNHATAREAARRTLSAEEEFDSVSPGVGPTLSDLQYACRLAHFVRLQHPIYNSVEIEWRVNTQVMMLEIVIRANVPNRDHYPDTVRPEAEYGTGFEDSFGLPRYIRDMPMVPVSGAVPVILTREQVHGSRDTLLMHLADTARKALISMVTHEVEEMILVGNERVFDPHAMPPLKMKYTF